MREKKDWLKIWMDDRQGLMDTMARNMASDLAAGYDYFGRCIQKQIADLNAYRAEYDAELMRFAGMTDGEVARWCYFDLLRRGAITR